MLSFYHIMSSFLEKQDTEAQKQDKVGKLGHFRSKSRIVWISAENQDKVGQCGRPAVIAVLEKMSGNAGALCWTSAEVCQTGFWLTTSSLYISNICKTLK